MNTGTYKEVSFKNLTGAKKKAKCMKKMYGYEPSIFKVTHPKSGKKVLSYSVVEPKNLGRI